ncbi:site-specific integrase [soil metagenome]
MAENTLRFTTARLEKLVCPDGAKQSYFYDDEIRGLCLYVAITGAKTFYLYRRIAGRPTRVRLGSWPHELTLDDARKEARKASGEIAKGNDPHQTKLAARGEMTFGELFSKHLDNAKVHNKTWKENQRQYDHYLKHWKARRLSDITRADVAALHTSIGEKHGKYIANRVLAAINHMFNTTAINCGWDKPNPATRIQKFKEKSRERFLHADELPRFFEALEHEDYAFRDFFTLAILTGARKANLLSMRWEDVHLERATWVIPVTKNGDAVTVPLCPEAVELLTRRKAGANESPFVFSSHGKTGHLAEPKMAWRRILKRAKLEDLRLHDLRRTFGSWQAAAGVSLPIIGKSMGHKSQLTTAIYARLSVEPVRAAVNLATSAMMAAAKGEVK